MAEVILTLRLLNLELVVILVIITKVAEVARDQPLLELVAEDIEYLACKRLHNAGEIDIFVVEKYNTYGEVRAMVEHAVGRVAFKSLEALLHVHLCPNVLVVGARVHLLVLVADHVRDAHDGVILESQVLRVLAVDGVVFKIGRFFAELDRI